ncbi:MAG: hypothetical protein KDH09_03280 [Chrysiogenetes bacterium]|nr:hypothetical protein [Chrysiogenetes bacterium]
MRKATLTFVMLLGLLGVGCSSTTIVPGSGRVMVGQLVAAPMTSALSQSENAVLFMTRGGVFSSAALDEDGNFAVPIPDFDTTGALVIRLNVILPGGGQEIRVDAVLVDDSSNGVFRVAGGEDDIELTAPLSVDLDADTISFASPMDIPAELTFLSAPYSKQDLCAYLPGSPSANCAFSELHGCVEGDADAATTCVESAAPEDAVLLACNPCQDLTDPADFTGPFSIGTVGIGSGSLVAASPLPQIVTPFRGLAVTGLWFYVPASDFGGAPGTSINLNLAARPDIFLTDPTDSSSYRFVFESGERFSAEQLVPLTLPVLESDSGERVLVTYYTTSGTLSTTLCGCGDSAPQCSFLPGACTP